MILESEKAITTLARRIVHAALGVAKVGDTARKHGAEEFLKLVFRQSYSSAFSDKLALFQTMLEHCRKYRLPLESFLVDLQCCQAVLLRVQEAARRKHQPRLAHLCRKAELRIQEVAMLWSACRQVISGGLPTPLPIEPAKDEKNWSDWTNHTQAVLQSTFLHRLNNHLASLLPSAQLLLDAVRESQKHYYARIIVNSATRINEEIRQFRLFRGQPRRDTPALNASALLQTLRDVLRRSLGSRIPVAIDMPEDFPLLLAHPLEALALLLVAGHFVIQSAGRMHQLTVCARSVATPFPEAPPQPAGHQLFICTSVPKNVEVFSNKTLPEAAGTRPVSMVLLETQARRLGWRVWQQESLECRQGVGFTIPASQKTAGQRETSGSDEAVIGSKKILLVEDDKDLAEIISLMAGELGYEVQWASSGREGLDFLDRGQKRFCAVVVDLSLPDVPVRQFLEDLRHRETDLPVILSTGYGEQETLGQLKGMRIQGVLTKPFTFTSFRKALNQVTDSVDHR